MGGITREALQKLRSDKWRRLVFPILVAAPVALVLFARWQFNNIIETQLVDFGFFGPERGLRPAPVDRIPADVTESLYQLGFAICASVALCVALVVASGLLVYGAFRKASRRRMHLGIMLGLSLVLFLGLAFDHGELSNRPKITHIAVEIINHTLGTLPSCIQAGSKCVDATNSIGDTSKSLLRIVSLAFGLIAAAGFSYIYSIALAATQVQHDSKNAAGAIAAEKSKKSINDISILAAITFLSTILVAQFLFEPGQLMLDRAVKEERWAKAQSAAGTASEVLSETKSSQEESPPTAMEDARDRYQHLRHALLLYWSVIFSMAIASGLFPALIYHSILTQEPLSVESFWSVGKKVLTALTPIIGGGVFSLLSDIVDKFASGPG